MAAAAAAAASLGGTTISSNNSWPWLSSKSSSSSNCKQSLHWRSSHGLNSVLQQSNKYNGISSCISCKRKQNLFKRVLGTLPRPSATQASGEIKLDAFDGSDQHQLRDSYSPPEAHQEHHSISNGKPGFVSFHGFSRKQPHESFSSLPVKDKSKLIWFAGPAILVASLVFPSFYLRRTIALVFEDSLLTDFLILFFTEALFYAGVFIFVALLEHMHKPRIPSTAKAQADSMPKGGFLFFSVVALVLSLTVPLVTMGLVWPWTGPAASATLAPYLIGLVVQFAFEQYAKQRRSSASAVIPVIFQVYRLHQLNRAAQLVTALSFSVRGAEVTAQTVAINNSLGTLLNVLQFLGVICIWSLATFLMRVIPFWSTVPTNNG